MRTARALMVDSSTKALVKDPVCGMSVDPATAKASVDYKGKIQYFCCTHCAEKFKADPEKYLSSPAGLLHLGHAKASSTLRSEEHTSELQSHVNLVCRLLLEK